MTESEKVEVQEAIKRYKQKGDTAAVEELQNYLKAYEPVEVKSTTPPKESSFMSGVAGAGGATLLGGAKMIHDAAMQAAAQKAAPVGTVSVSAPTPPAQVPPPQMGRKIPGASGTENYARVMAPQQLPDVVSARVQDMTKVNPQGAYQVAARDLANLEKIKAIGGEDYRLSGAGKSQLMLPEEVATAREAKAAAPMTKVKAAVQTAKEQPGSTLKNISKGLGSVASAATGSFMPNIALKATTGFGAGVSADQALQAYNRDQYGRALLHGMGAAGDLATMSRHPAAMIPGIAAGLGGPALAKMIDKLEKKNPELVKKLKLAEGGLVHLADGGATMDAVVPQGVLPPMPTQPRPFYGMGDDVRNVEGTTLPTDANYTGPMPKLYGQGPDIPTNTGGSVVQMFGGIPQGTTPIMPAQPRPFYGMGDDVRNVEGTILPTDANYTGPMPKLYGQGPELATNDGGSVVQMFGGIPQGTTPIMPAQPRPFYGMGDDVRNVEGTILPTDANYTGPMPKLYGQGPDLPTNTGGSVVQMFGGRPQQPLPFERAQTMMQQRNPQVIPQKRVINPPRRPVAPPRPQLLARPQMMARPNPRMPAPRAVNFNTGRSGGLSVLRRAEGGSTTPAWQRSEGKNPEGGLNAAGRASYNRETGGNLKAPQPEGGSRKKSFCARMGGMKKKLTSSKTANDPDSRINKALRKWKC